MSILLAGTQRTRLEYFKKDTSFKFLLQDFKSGIVSSFWTVLACLAITGYGYDGALIYQAAFVVAWMTFAHTSACVARVVITLWRLINVNELV